jgi:hypothetical protein
MSAQSILEISLYGPMGVRLTDSCVKVYVPQCDDHLLFFQTDRDDKYLAGAVATPGPLHPAYEYRVRAVVANCSKSVCHNPIDLIVVPWSRCKEYQGPTPERCYAILHLPLPDRIIGLIPDPVTITQFDISSTPDNTPKSTAMRLVYSGFNPTMGLQLYEKGGSQPIIDTGTYPPLPDLEPEVSVTFRYAAKTLTDSDKDAADCFWHLRDLFPPLGAWRAEFESPITSGLESPIKSSLFTGTSGDCKSPSILFATINHQNVLFGDRPSAETVVA